jgi:broad specificity phosphatase PhoE
VRHAEPDNWGSASLRYDIPPGPALSQKGRAQALEAAEFLSQDPPAAIFASPLERTRETARIIGERLGIQPVVDVRIAEHCREEDASQVAQRALEFWHERLRLANGDASGRIAIVSHGSPIRILLESLARLPQLTVYRFDHGNIVPLAGIWRVARHRSAGPLSNWKVRLVFPSQI